MNSMEEKITELKSELETIVGNYNQAIEVTNNCKTRISQLQGAIGALSEFVEPVQDATPASVEID
tara:strand:- start:2409 stop:2603 length:195 start_codon:yes stop_codon:yes gene_type:complete